jgi:hypothetical protein
MGSTGEEKREKRKTREISSGFFLFLQLGPVPPPTPRIGGDALHRGIGHERDLFAGLLH